MNFAWDTLLNITLNSCHLCMCSALPSTMNYAWDTYVNIALDFFSLWTYINFACAVDFVHGRLWCTYSTQIIFSLQMSQSSSFSSNNSGKEKSPYNKHFPQSFLLNYGGALHDPSNEATLKRVHDFNCEWLKRPNIPISKLTQTLRLDGQSFRRSHVLG